MRTRKEIVHEEETLVEERLALDKRNQHRFGCLRAEPIGKLEGKKRLGTTAGELRSRTRRVETARQSRIIPRNRWNDPRRFRRKSNCMRDGIAKASQECTAGENLMDKKGRAE